MFFGEYVFGGIYVFEVFVNVVIGFIESCSLGDNFFFLYMVFMVFYDFWSMFLEYLEWYYFDSIVLLFNFMFEYLFNNG